MAKIIEATLSEKISALEQRVTEKFKQSKVIDDNGHMLGSVKLRLKKLNDGRLRFYLDINRKNAKRMYKFLDCYLNPTLVVKALKVEKKKQVVCYDLGLANDTALLNADNERAAWEKIIKEGKPFCNKSKEIKDISLLDWLEAYRQQKEKTGQSNRRALSVQKLMIHVEAYKGKKTKLADIDEEWCKGFIAYLATAKSCKHTKNEKTIAHTTATLYFSILIAALNEAVRKKLIPTNPTKNLNREEKKPIKADKSNRPYLTIAEVKKLMATDCRKPEIKKAFLFACFTGLRISDIRNLTWANISNRDGSSVLSITMQKTREALTMKLNKQALALIPEHGTGSVFDLPVWDSMVNDCIKSWAKEAGIDKDISFHCSRHTFATMELTLGADLYVVSKLLGHSNVGTTQIYADIINKRRDEAVELIDNAFKKEDRV